MSEAATLWLIGLQSTVFFIVIGFLARSLGSHTQEWREWQQRFLVEHGEIKGQLRMLLKQLGVHTDDPSGS